MDESKQNPDELLKLIHKEEQQEKEPSKVFFGYTAVLDKTRAMLKAVHAVSDFAPNLNVHTSPDTVSGVPAYRAKKAKRKNGIIFSAADILKCITILIVSSLIGTAFRNLGFDEANIITVYVLGVLVASVITTHQVYSLISSIVSVLVFNFLFTEPKFTLQAYEQGYPVTFIIMFLAAFLTGSLAARLKNHAEQSAQAAYRTKVLFDTNQLLQQASSRDDIISATANQLIKLLGKDIVFYPAENEKLTQPHIFSATEKIWNEHYISDTEKAVAQWVLKNNKHAGATTQTFSNAKCLYIAVRVNNNIYGVVGIVMSGQPPDTFENSILLSILGECALTLENEKNAKEKEEAAVLAKNEQLRANLLRSISHDLRTPLTAISGNADVLLSDGEDLSAKKREGLLRDIRSDAMWLNATVENLLAITRLENGEVRLSTTTELLDDIVEEALRHVSPDSEFHDIEVESSRDLLLVDVDARLMVQVVVNLLNNAVAYTQVGSRIRIMSHADADVAVVRVEDNGPGIAEGDRSRVFESFYTASHALADSKRSVGLGLALCKSIVEAHGGSIGVDAVEPHGCAFWFTLPLHRMENGDIDHAD